MMRFLAHLAPISAFGFKMPQIPQFVANFLPGALVESPPASTSTVNSDLINFSIPDSNTQEQYKFLILNATQVNDMAPAVNYGFYYNIVSYQLNNHGLPDKTKEIETYFKNTVENLSKSKKPLANNRILLPAIDKLFIKLFEIQLNAIENNASNDSKITILNVLKLFYTLLNPADKEFLEQPSKMAIFEKQQLFSRIASDLICALEFFKEKSSYKSQMDALINNILIGLTSLETTVLKNIQDIKQQTPLPCIHNFAISIDTSKDILKTFVQIASLIRNCYSEFCQKAISFEITGIDEKNQVINLFIINRFLTLCSLLEMVGNFTVQISTSVCSVFLLNDFFTSLKAALVHYILSFADYSIYHVTSNLLMDKNASQQSRIQQLANKAMNLPDNLQYFAKCSPNIGNVAKFDSYNSENFDKANERIIKQYYSVIIPEMFRNAKPKFFKSPILNNIIKFTNLKKNENLEQKFLSFLFSTISSHSKNFSNHLNSFSNFHDYFFKSMIEEMKTQLNEKLSDKGDYSKSFKKLVAIKFQNSKGLDALKKIRDFLVPLNPDPKLPKTNDKLIEDIIEPEKGLFYLTLIISIALGIIYIYNFLKKAK